MLRVRIVLAVLVTLCASHWQRSSVLSAPITIRSIPVANRMFDISVPVDMSPAAIAHQLCDNHFISSLGLLNERKYEDLGYFACKFDVAYWLMENGSLSLPAGMGGDFSGWIDVFVGQGAKTVRIEPSKAAITIALHLCVDSLMNSVSLYSCAMDVAYQITFVRVAHSLPVFSYQYYNYSQYWRPRHLAIEHIESAAENTGPAGSVSSLVWWDNGQIMVTRPPRGERTEQRSCDYLDTHIHADMEHLAWVHGNNLSTNRSSLKGSSDRTTTPPTAAIVYLARNIEHSVKELKLSLDLLYSNYNTLHKHDVWIFHEGDFDLMTQRDIRQERGEIRFYRLTVNSEVWREYPDFVRGQQHMHTQYPLGYRKMCRWFSVTMWRVLDAMGYEYVMRMDDDSYILSPIPYDIFAFMSSNHFDYAYRTGAVEAAGNLYWDFVQTYARSKGWGVAEILPLMDSCQDKTSLDDFNFANCGLLRGFYNNFFVSRVQRWLEDDVQDLLGLFDNSGMMFLERWGDLTVHSTVVKLLFPPSSVHRFVGWGYAHASKPNGIVQAGVWDENPAHTLLKFPFSDFWGDDEVEKEVHWSGCSQPLLTKGSLRCGIDKHWPCLG